jgi:hypothetical protein
MPEKVLPLALSGEEVRKAICDRLDQVLARDCRLTPEKAYQFFSAKITVHVECTDIGRVEVIDQEVPATLGEPDENEALEHFDAEFEMAPAPPNEVRVESGQPVPVETKDSSGKATQKGIRYSRKSLEKAKS